MLFLCSVINDYKFVIHQYKATKLKYGGWHWNTEKKRTRFEIFYRKSVLFENIKVFVQCIVDTLIDYFCYSIQWMFEENSLTRSPPPLQNLFLHPFVGCKFNSTHICLQGVKNIITRWVQVRGNMGGGSRHPNQMSRGALSWKILFEDWCCRAVNTLHLVSIPLILFWILLVNSFLVQHDIVLQLISR